MYLFNEGKLNVDMEQWQDKSIMLLAEYIYLERFYSLGNEF